MCKWPEIKSESSGSPHSYHVPVTAPMTWPPVFVKTSLSQKALSTNRCLVSGESFVSTSLLNTGILSVMDQ